MARLGPVLAQGTDREEALPRQLSVCPQRRLTHHVLKCQRTGAPWTGGPQHGAVLDALPSELGGREGSSETCVNEVP